MGITVNTSPQQITASVGETKIDVSVSGGIGPSGAGASTVSWNEVTGKPSEFTPSAHASTHAPGGADELFDQSLNTDDSPTFYQLSLGDQTADIVQFGWQGGEFQISGFGRHIGIETGYIGGDWGFSNGASWNFAGCTVTGLSYNSLDDLPTLFDGAYTSLTSVPSTFAPSAHKTSHATGGSDALTASDIGAAAASHAHAWSDITSGVPSTFTPSAHNQAWSTITSTPTTLSGYGITDAVASNDARLTDARTPTSHAHGNITNAGAIGSTANLPVITTTSGVLTTGTFGTAANSFCQGNDSRLTATIARFTPDMNQPPASAYALLDTRNSILVLAFDPNTQWSAVFCGVIPQNASLANGLTVRLWWMGATATSGNVRWGVSFEKVGTDNDADSFDTVTQAHSAANGTSGIETVTSITATAIDSLAAGDRFRLKVTRIADDATNDTMTGNAQLVAVEVQVA